MPLAIANKFQKIQTKDEESLILSFMVRSGQSFLLECMVRKFNQEIKVLHFSQAFILGKSMRNFSCHSNSVYYPQDKGRLNFVDNNMALSLQSNPRRITFISEFDHDFSCIHMYISLRSTRNSRSVTKV